MEDQQIGDSDAIREASSFHPGHKSVGDLQAEFGEKPRLADARLADEADRLSMAVFHLPEKIVQDRKFALAIDKNCGTRRWRLAEPRAPMGNAEQPMGRNRLCLAFEDERSDRLATCKAFRQQARVLAVE